MSARLRRSPSRWLAAGALALWFGCSAACLAKTTGVDEDPALQSGPCYQTLVDRNVSQPTTAPNRELGAACASEHGDVERAWARVVRLWGSDSAEVPDYDSYARADAVASDSPIWLVLAIAGMVLAYAVCGTPSRSAARMMSGGGRAIEAAGTAFTSLVARGLFGLLLLWLLGLPYLSAIAALAFVVLLARDLGGSNASRARPAEPETRGFASFAAETINDLGGAALGLLGLTLLARHDWRLLALGVALTMAASFPAVVVGRRELRAHPRTKTMLAALLAAAIGAGALFETSLGSLAQAGALPRLAAALVLAMAVGAWGWRIGMLSPISTQSEGPNAGH